MMNENINMVELNDETLESVVGGNIDMYDYIINTNNFVYAWKFLKWMATGTRD